MDKLTPKMKENFQKYADRLPIARQLVTLKNDVEFDFDPEKCLFPGLNIDALAAAFGIAGIHRPAEAAWALAMIRRRRRRRSKRRLRRIWDCSARWRNPPPGQPTASPRRRPARIAIIGSSRRPSSSQAFSEGAEEAKALCVRYRDRCPWRDGVDAGGDELQLAGRERVGTSRSSGPAGFARF